MGKGKQTKGKQLASRPQSTAASNPSGTLANASADLVWDAYVIIQKAFPTLPLPLADIKKLKKKYPTAEDFAKFYRSVQFQQQLNEWHKLFNNQEETVTAMNEKIAACIAAILPLFKQDQAKELQKPVLELISNILMPVQIVCFRVLLGKYALFFNSRSSLTIEEAKQMLTKENNLIKQVKLGLAFYKQLNTVGSNKEQEQSYLIICEDVLRHVFTKTDQFHAESEHAIARKAFNEFLEENKKKLSSLLYCQGKALLAIGEGVSLTHQRERMIKLKNMIQQIPMTENKQLAAAITVLVPLAYTAAKRLEELASKEKSLAEQYRLMNQAIFYHQLGIESAEKLLELTIYELKVYEKDPVAVHSLLVMQKNDTQNVQIQKNELQKLLAKDKAIRLELLKALSSFYITDKTVKANQIILTLTDEKSCQLLLSQLHAKGINCHIDGAACQKIIVEGFTDVSMPSLQKAIDEFNQHRTEQKTQMPTATKTVLKINEDLIPKMEMSTPNEGMIKPIKAKEEENPKDEVEEVQPEVKQAKIITMKDKKGKNYVYEENDPTCQVYKLHGFPNHFIKINDKLFATLAQQDSSTLKILQDLCTNGTVISKTKGRSGWILRGDPFEEYKQGLDLDFRSNEQSQTVKNEKRTEDDFSVNYGRGKNPGVGVRFFSETVARGTANDKVYHCMEVVAVKMKKETKK